jgi:hypothetical protein
MGLPLQGQLAPAADAATLRLAASMKPVEVANLLVAYANGGWQLSSLVAAALLQRLEQVLPEAYPQAVANSLWAAAKLGLRLSGSLKTAFVPALPRIIPAATSQAFLRTWPIERVAETAKAPKPRLFCGLRRAQTAGPSS